MNSIEALAPCPMCGATPVMDGRSDDCRIRCEECGVQGPPSFFDSEDDAQIEVAEAACIAAWNRRAAEGTAPIGGQEQPESVHSGSRAGELDTPALPEVMPPEIEGRLSLWLTFGADLHPQTVNLVVRFARALAKKLADAETKYGYSDGWRSADWMDECRTKLMEHIAKGDPRDVAAYCAFLWHHGESTASNAAAGAQKSNEKAPASDLMGFGKIAGALLRESGSVEWPALADEKAPESAPQGEQEVAWTDATGMHYSMSMDTALGELCALFQRFPNGIEEMEASLEDWKRQAGRASIAPAGDARAVLAEAVRLYTNYGLVAGHIEGEPMAAGRWINSARALLATPAPDVPAGWKLVPIEPTPEMIAAAVGAVLPDPHPNDFELARSAARLILMHPDTPPSCTVEGIASAMATIIPAHRALMAAAPDAAIAQQEPQK